MKKLLYLPLTVLALCISVGCGGSGSDEDASTADGTETPAASATSEDGQEEGEKDMMESMAPGSAADPEAGLNNAPSALDSLPESKTN